MNMKMLNLSEQQDKKQVDEEPWFDHPSFFYKL